VPVAFVATTRKWYVVPAVRPANAAETGTALVPDAGDGAQGTAAPYAVLVPQSKWQSVTAAPDGLTDPFSVAADCVTPEAG
jgi:hypothetical protein